MDIRAAPGAAFVDGAGRAGKIESPEPNDDPRSARVRLDDGRRATVPLEALRPLPDGRFELGVDLDSLDPDRNGDDEASAVTVVPVTEETIRVDRRARTTGRVLVEKAVREHETIVDAPVFAETVAIDRVPINRFVEAAPEVRREGDVTVVPVLEEVLVVEKRLRLVEEVRITRNRVETRTPQRVTLRSEEVTVRRSDEADGHERDEDGA